MVDTHRGYPMYEDDQGVWRYVDNGDSVAENWTNRPCGHCGLHIPDGEPDPCLGRLPGVTNACCGHGDPKQAYVCFDNGLVVRGFRVDEFCYRDEKENKDGDWA